MSSAVPCKVFPTWRGLATRPMWNGGSDVMKGNDSWLAAKMADQIIFREMTRKTLVEDEVPGCWSASFRGALRELNKQLWTLQVLHARN